MCLGIRKIKKIFYPECMGITKLNDLEYEQFICSRVENVIK
jgi:hypothetical protein